MKFKASLASPDQLAKLLQTLSKTADSCVVHLRPDMLQFAVAADAKTDGLHVCADVDQTRIFWEYNVQSRAEDNRISFFVKIENLCRALRSCCSNKTESPVQVRCVPARGPSDRRRATDGQQPRAATVARR